MKMTPTISRWLLAPAFLLFIPSCRPDDGYPKNVDGWSPIYASTDSIKKVESVAARSIEDGGKIYIKDKILYQVENGRGIHVINYADPAAPQKLGFIRCFGAQELSIRDNYLYTNNVNDLVVLDITNLNDVKVVGRKENMLTIISTAPPESGYFDCPDKNKGEIVGWERKLLQSPRCRR